MSFNPLSNKNEDRWNTEWSAPLAPALLKPLDSLIEIETEENSIKCVTYDEKEWAELLEKSQLDHPLIHDILPLEKNAEELDPIFGKILGYILGEGIINETDLEGLNSQQAVDTILQMMEMYEKLQKSLPQSWNEVKSKLQQFKESLVEIEDLRKELNKHEWKRAAEILRYHALKIAKTIENLSNGENYLFECSVGLDGNKRETLLFEFQKTGNQTFEITIYATGKSAGEYQTLLFLDKKTKLRPVLQFKDVPAAAFLFADEKTQAQPDFFQSLLEITLIQKEKYSIHHILTHHCALLHAYRVHADQELIGFVTSARAETSAWRSLKAFALKHFGSKSYKDFIFAIKYQALREGYQKTKTLLEIDSADGDRVRSLLKAGARGILRTLSKGEPSEIKHIEARATANALLKRIEDIEKNLEQRRLEKTNPLAVESESVAETRHQRMVAVKNAQMLIANAKTENPKIQETSLHFETIPPAKDLSSFLSQLKSSNDPLCRCAEIDHLVKQFPIPLKNNNYWDQLSNHTIHETIKALDNLVTEYCDSIQKLGKPPQNEQLNTISALYIIIHHLALQTETHPSDAAKNENILTKYPLYYPAHSLDADPYLVFHDPRDFERREVIISYFKKHYECNPHLGSKTQFVGLSMGSLRKIKNGIVPLSLFNFGKHQFADNYSGAGDFYFYQDLIERYPALKNLAEQKIEKLPNSFTHEEQLAITLMAHPELLKQAHLDHLYALWKVAFTTYHCYSPNFLQESKKFSAVVCYSKDQEEMQKLFVEYKMGEKVLGRSSMNFSFLHPPLNATLDKLLKESLECVRLIPTENKPLEGEVLLDKNLENGSYKFPARETLLTGCEPDLQPQQLLSLYSSSHLASLSSSQEQTFFEIQFLKAVVEEGRQTEVTKELSQTDYLHYARTRRLIVRDELRSQKTFAQRCQTFIQEGIDLFCTRQPKQRPNVYATLFFIRLAHQLRTYLEDHPHKELIIDYSSFLDTLLSRQDLTSEEKNYLSLHRILLLSEIPADQLTPVQQEKVLTDWVYHNNHALPLEWTNPSRKKEAQRTILNLIGHSDLKDKLKLAEKMLNSLNLEGTLNNAQLVESSPRLIHIVLEDNRFWTIDLVTGNVYNETGLLTASNEAPWEKANASRDEEELFTQLFNKKKFPYKQTGSTLYFADPSAGVFRVYQKSLVKGLQRKIGSTWYQYVGPRQLVNSFIPRAYIDGHTHWISIDAKDSHLVILTKDGKTIAKVDEKGILHLQDETTAYRMSYPQFELSDYTLLHQKAVDSSPLLLEFTRYQSLDKTPLHFDIQEGKVIWRDNQKYVLIPEQKKGLLKKIPNYLFLQHSKDATKQKILVPCHVIKSSKELSQEIEIDLPKFGTFHQSQNLQFTFIEFDLKNGEPEALNAEGNLYLAYLNLSSQNYHKALHYLKAVEANDFLSNISFEILQYIESISTINHDFSSSCASIRLHAFLLQMKIEKAQNKKAQNKKIGSDPSNAKAALSIYHEGFNQVQAGLELTQEQEEILRTLFNRKKQKNYERGGNQGEGKNTLSVLPKVQEYLPLFKFPRPTHSQTFGEDNSYRGFYGSTINTNTKLPNPKAGFESSSYIRDFSGTRIDTSGMGNRSFVFNNTTFLPESEDQLGYHKPFLLTETYKNQAYFYEAYQIATRDPKDANFSTAQKNQLAFRLEMWGTNPNNSTVRQFDKESLSYLAFVTLHPTDKPKLPPIISIDEKTSEQVATERWDFLCQLTKNMRYVKTSVDSDDKLKKNNDDTFKREESPETGLVAATLLKLPPKERPLDSPGEKVASQSLNFKEIDQEFLPTIFSTHFEPISKNSPREKEISFEFQKQYLASEEEQFFEKALKEEFNEFNRDYQKGQQINKERSFYDIKGLEKLQNTLQKRAHIVTHDLNALEKGILALANRKETNIEEKQKSLMLEEGAIKAPLKMKDLDACFLRQKAEFFRRANPLLTNEEIDRLASLLASFHEMKAYVQGLQRAIGLCKRIQSSDALTKTAYIQKLAEELQPLEVPAFDSKEFPEMAVFQTYSNMRIRPNQGRLLKLLLEKDHEGKFCNRVVQLIMGGGKTTVLASIIAFLSAKPDRLSLFITPSSQYQTVLKNLMRSQRKYFDQEVETIDFTRSQLTLDRLKEIEEQLANGMKKGNLLVMKAEMLQVLELEFLTLVKKVAESSESHSENVTTALNKINSLRRILLVFRNHGDALMDEVDLVLNALQEVNFPLGEIQKIAPSRIELIRYLFSFFAKNENLLHLRSNQQTLITPENYRKLCTLTAKELLTNYKALQLSSYEKDYLPSFERYITGKMPVKLEALINKDTVENLNEEETSDLNFLRHVRKLRESQNPEEVEAAHLIALTKHMMITVFPSTFDKIGGRQYGRTRKDDQAGKVVPYLAVDTPATTEFGYHYEALAYQFQTALQFGILQEQVQVLAKRMREEATYYSQRTRENFNQTAEAIEFKSLTGVDLEEIDLPGKLEEATLHLNKSVEAVLRAEAETAAHCVTYHPLRLTATAQTIVRQVNTKRAFSGTPWNAQGYDKSLSMNCILDVGTEGQIADEMLVRSAKQEPIHSVTKEELEDLPILLKKLLGNHPKKERVRMLLDSGGLLKKYTNEQVAKALRDYLEIPVFFFTRPPYSTKEDLNQEPPDTLALFKKDKKQTQPIIVGGTDIADIEKTGLEIEDYFVYNDDRHTTGTNIPVIPDAIGLVTIDETLLRRTYFQTVIRLRDFFLHQDIEYVIPDYVSDTLLKNPANSKVLSTLLSATKNQAIQKAKHLYRSFRQKIDNVFYQELLQENLLTEGNLTEAKLKKVYAPFDRLIASDCKDSPYDQFGSLEDWVDTLTNLTNYRDRKLAAFTTQDPKIKERVEIQLKEIIDEARECLYLQSKVRDAQNSNLNMQVDILKEVSVQVQKNTNVNMDQELLKELQYHFSIEKDQLVTETEWTSSTIGRFLENVMKTEKMEKIESLISMPDLFQLFPYKNDYSKVFGPNILATKNWHSTTNNVLPVFHSLQRPASQILVIKTTKGFQFVLLSKKEAKAFKNYLRVAYQKDSSFNQVWLIQNDGSLLEENPHRIFPSHEKEVKQALVECNAFNGNAEYLDAHSLETSEWLSQGATKQKIQFLQLKVEKSPTQRKIFYNNPILNPVSTNTEIRSLSRLERDRLEKLSPLQVQALDEKDKGTLQKLGKNQVPHVHPSQVKWLAIYQLNWLITKEQVKEVPEHLVNFLDVSQIALIAKPQVHFFKHDLQKTQHISVELLGEMDSDQLKMLSSNQIRQITNVEMLRRLSKSQIADLREDQVQNLTDLELIKKLSPKQWGWITGTQIKKGLIDETQIPYLRREDAIQALSVDQLHLVSASIRKESISQEQIQSLEPVKHGKIIEELTVVQVDKITSPNVIAELSDDKIPFVNPTMVKHVKKEKIHLLTHEDQLKEIDREMVSLLPKKEQWKKLPDAFLENLEKSQVETLDSNALNEDPELITLIQRLPDSHIPFVHPEAVSYVKPEQLRFLVTPEQIQNVDSQKLSYLKPAQAIHLSEIQVQTLDDRTLNEIKKENIQLTHPTKATYNLNAFFLEKSSSLKTYAKAKTCYKVMAIVGIILTALAAGAAAALYFRSFGLNHTMRSILMYASGGTAAAMAIGSILCLIGKVSAQKKIHRLNEKITFANTASKEQEAVNKTVKDLSDKDFKQFVKRIENSLNIKSEVELKALAFNSKRLKKYFPYPQDNLLITAIQSVSRA